MSEAKQAKRFVIKMTIFCMPFLALFILGFLLDPFKVWFNHSEYYTNNFVQLNRSLIGLKLLKKNTQNGIKYNSFIFGSSRSHAFKISEWKKYIGPESTGFHFDSLGEDLKGIYNKILYVHSKKIPLDNVLIIICNDMTFTKNKKSHITISPPELSRESSISFYLKFIEAHLDFKFIVGYIDYKLFHKYRKYMKAYFVRSKYSNQSDNLTGDIFYGYDKMIQENENAYYQMLIKKGEFSGMRNLSNKNSNKEKPISDEEKILLYKIMRIFILNKTKYKIIVSPLYDQEKISMNRIEILRSIFGSNNVYDFSGINKFTESIYNFYERSHYRPHVANEIMRIIYNQVKN